MSKPQETPEEALPISRIRILPVGERPQERLEQFGPFAVSDTELLAMLLRSGTRGQDVLSLATRLLSEAGSLAGLLAWHEADFRRLRGIGRVKALQLVAAMEVARRAGSGETFWQFRPFLSGEPSSRVDWRRSAREERAFVREREWEAAHT
ncbi:MAG TPA: UPF0758 domain-containing protein, partial [Opitutaceae bacterium]